VEQIWEISAGNFLLIAVMCFFCKKKSRSVTERQYDAGRKFYSKKQSGYLLKHDEGSEPLQSKHHWLVSLLNSGPP